MLLNCAHHHGDPATQRDKARRENYGEGRRDKVTPSLHSVSIEQFRMGTKQEFVCVCGCGCESESVCVRLDKAEEWRRVIEISIKEVISGVIAEVLWCECVLVCVCV